MIMLRAIAFIVLLSSGLFAQMPKGVYNWWARPQIARSLNLTQAQRQQIRATVQQYRPRLMEVRGRVEQAEQELAGEFNHDPVDAGKTNEATEKLIAARSDL